MPDVKLHLTSYKDNLGEQQIATTRRLQMPELPKNGQYLILNKEVYFVSNVYLAIEEEIDSHIFATKTSAPYQELQQIGLPHPTMPSSDTFDGRTVADLMAFLSQFPAEVEVVFDDRQVLYAKSKSDMLILRLDPHDQ